MKNGISLLVAYAVKKPSANYYTTKGVKLIKV